MNEPARQQQAKTEPPQQNPGAAAKLLASLTDPKQYAVLAAEGRRGLKDLQDAVLQPFPDSGKSRDEPGTIGNPTQMQVHNQLEGKQRKPLSLDELRDYAKGREAEALGRMEGKNNDRDNGPQM